MNARTSAQRPAEPTAYDRRMFALMNREAGQAYYATAARRRLLVGAHLALTLSATGAWIMTTATGPRRPLFVLLGLLLPWCVATGMINAATRGLLELRGRILDERQRAERDRVLARSHRVTTLLLLAAVLVTAAVGWFHDVRVETLIAPVLVGVLVVQWLLPLWVAGLRAEDEPADDLSVPGGE